MKPQHHKRKIIAKKKETVKHIGRTFDSFLEEEGIRAEVEALAEKRLLDWQLSRTMKPRKQ